MSLNQTNTLSATVHIIEETITSIGAHVVGTTATGVGAHVTGAAVEMAAITYLPLLPYGYVYKVPVAKCLHELTEGFVSASMTINIHDNNSSLLEATLNITKPIWGNPGKTIVSGAGSYLFELGIIKLSLYLLQHKITTIALHSCNHHGHGHDHHHHHSIYAELFSAGTLIKGLASVAGSFITGKVYDMVMSGDSNDNIDEL